MFEGPQKMFPRHCVASPRVLLWAFAMTALSCAADDKLIGRSVLPAATFSEDGLMGDVGLGFNFAFPFETIEDVLFFDAQHIGVLNDNNFPFSVGRHVGAAQPDDNEFIVIQLDQPLGLIRRR